MIDLFYSVIFKIQNSETSRITDTFFSVFIILLVPAFIYLILFFFQFLSKNKKRMINSKNSFEYKKLSLIIPIHTESEALIQENINSLKGQIYPEMIEVFLCPSNSSSTQLMNDWIQNSPENIQFSIFQASNNSKAQKIIEVLNLVKTDYVGIIDVDHTVSPHWCKNSFEAIQTYDENCIGVQGIRKLKGQSKLITLWDSMLNHFLNEVRNISLERCQLNIPFTGTSALFKTSIFKEIEIRPHLTEDTNWFMRLSRNCSKYLVYQGEAPTYEKLPENFQNFISRRIRWSTGHTQSYLETIKLKSNFNLSYHIHGLFYIIGALLFLTLVIRSMYLLIQFPIGFIINYIILTLLSIWANYHLLLAFIPLSIIALPVWNKQIIGSNLFFSEIFLAPEITKFILVFYIILLTFLIISRGKKGMYHLGYLKPIAFSPILIILELYCAFAGIVNLSSQKTVWNTHKKNRYAKFNLILLFGLISVNIWLKKDKWLPMIQMLPQLISPKKLDMNIKVSGDKLILGANNDFRIKGICMSGNYSEKHLLRIKQAGFNTVRFYSIPNPSMIKYMEKINLYSVINSDDSNWKDTDVRKLWDRISLQLDYLNILYYITHLEHKNILFPVFGNELEIWPIEIDSKFRNDGYYTANIISAELNKIFKKYSNSGHLFSYATIPKLSEGLKLDTSLVPIHLFNGNHLNYDLWKSFRKEQRPTFISEWGGPFNYKEFKNYFAPEYIKSFITEINHQIFQQSNLNGTFYFAVSDLVAGPKMNEFSDPFVQDENFLMGILDRDGNPKNSYWLLSRLNSDFELKTKNTEIILINQNQEPIHLRKINNHTLGKFLNTGESLSLPKSYFKSNNENFIEYEKGGKQEKFVLFHGNGYLSACEGNPIKIQDGKNNIDFEYFTISGDRESYKINNQSDYLELHSLDQQKNVILQINKVPLEINTSNSNLKLHIQKLAPCQKGSPFISQKKI